MKLTEISYKALLYRERQAAVAILEHYGISGAKLKLLSHEFNKTYRVDTTDGARYVLRVQREYNLSNPAYIRAEHAWLMAIWRDTDVQVPEPVANRDGDMLTILDHPLLGERYATLFRWLDGRLMGKDRTLTLLRKQGEVMAQLHQHAQHFSPPASFSRPRWDAAELVGARSAYGEGKLDEYLDTEAKAVFAATSEIISTVMQQLGEGSDSWGLIHSDMHPWNLLHEHGTVKVLDFEIGGWGHWLLDLSVPASMKLDPKYGAAHQSALLDGYAAVRPLPPHYEELLDTFIAARLFVEANWLFDGSDPAMLARTPQVVKRRVELFKQLLKL